MELGNELPLVTRVTPEEKGPLRLEEAALFGRAAVTLAKKVPGNFHGVGEGEQLIPRAGLAREDDFAGLCIPANRDLAGDETECGRQAEGLAANFLGEFSHAGDLLAKRTVASAWDIYRYITANWV